MRTKIFLGLCLLFLVSFIFVTCGGDVNSGYGQKSIENNEVSKNISTNVIYSINGWDIVKITDNTTGVICYVYSRGGIDCIERDR